ncbi:MAG: right-handed parallel beta-helix repeat-containing protein [Bacteroidales bacterium]
MFSNFAVKDGGGIYCDNHSHPNITEISVHDNACDVNGGGIMFNDYSNATLTDSEVYDNFALYRGGGIGIYFYSDVILDSLNIVNNTAAHGGGVYCSWDSDFQFKNSTIQQNNALSHVGGYFGTGGGCWISYNSDPLLENLEILFNHADNQGGGIYTSGGNNLELVNCFIDHNTSRRGGGMFVQGGTPHFCNAIVSNNQTTDGPGGGIYAESSNPVFTNLTIANNTVISEGYDYYGGALYNFNSNPVFTNSILWGNTPDEINTYSGTPVAEYCNIEGSYPGTGNINSDPLFEITANGIYDLGSGSPCINTGTPDTTGLNLPSTDFGNNDRISAFRIDMGAYEYQHEIFTIDLSLQVFLEGPFNGTGMNSNLTDIPLQQPYNIPPYNYNGEESLATIPSGMVDWILIEARKADVPANAFATAITDRHAGLLMSDGNVVGLDGVSPLEFHEFESTSFTYFVIRHRNHLDIINSIGYGFEAPGPISIDFTHGGPWNYTISGYIEVSPGTWAMVAGDANGDGYIDVSDKSSWQSQAGETIYLSEDFNLNGQVDNIDKNDFWYSNLEDESQVPD